MSQTEVVHCAEHPKVETNLRCNQCDTPICPRCLVQTPVGAKCKNCARLRRLPTFEVSPVQLLTGTVVGAGLGIGLGLAWGFLGRFIPFGSLLIPIGIAFVIGEGISLTVNQKRGRALLIVGAGGVLLSFMVSSSIRGYLFGGIDVYLVLGMVLAILLVVNRLR